MVALFLIAVANAFETGIGATVVFLVPDGLVGLMVEMEMAIEGGEFGYSSAVNSLYSSLR